MRRFLVPCVVIGVAVVAVGARYLRVTPTPTTQPLPKLAIADGRNHFGTVWESDQFIYVLPIVNEDDQPITVEDVRLSCSCMSVVPNTFTLSPGERIELRVRIDLTAKKRPSEEAVFELAPLVRRGTEPQVRLRWPLRGTVQQFIRLDRPPTFGRKSLSAPESPVVLRAKTAVPVPDGFDVQVSHPAYTVSVMSDTSDGRSHTVRITHTGPRTVGEVELDVTLRPRSNEKRTLPVSVIPVRWQVVHDVEALPPDVSAGGVRVGTTAAHRVSLASLTGASFKVVDWTVNGEGLTVERAGQEFVIRHTCQTAGMNAGRVSFRVSAADGEYVVPVEVSCLGIAE